LSDISASTNTPWNSDQLALLNQCINDKSDYSMVENNESTKIKHTLVQKEFWSAGVEAMSCRGGACSAIMVKKEAYKKLGYFIEKSLSSDVEMWHRVASMYDTVFLSEATIIFRVNSTSTGFDSLINRDVRDIKSDWDTLDNQMASHYPTKELQKVFLDDCFKRAPGSYFAITKANIRARRWKNVFESLIIIIFTYKGLIPLLIMISNILKKQFLLLIKK
jgi:hypothetical protein